MIKPINPIDRTAPRFRPKRKNVLSETFFMDFFKKYPEYEKYSRADLRKVIKTLSEILFKEAVEYRDGVELPENLGFIFIGTCRPPKKTNLDYKRSVYYGANVQHRNFESDNYIAKIFYTNYANKYKFRNRELWQFKGARNFTQHVHKTYPEYWKKYVMVENFEMINKYFKKNANRTYYAKKIQSDVLDYNEFEMD